MKQRSKLGVTILALVALVAMISCRGAFQQQSLPGDITNFSGVHVAAPTAIGSATPALMVNSDGLSVLFEVRDAATPVVSVNDGGVLDMKAHAVTNIGAAGTDFSGSGALTLATGLTVTSGGATITAGGVTITAGGLDMTNDAITNIGAAGTDFSATGGLTLADTLTVNNGAVIDGAADEIQIRVQGYTTQTNSLMVLEQSDGTDSLTVSNAGNVDVVGTLQFGANDFYPLGYASSGEQIIFGSTTITNSGTVAHGLTTPSYGLCTYSGTLTDNEEQKCSVNISGATVTVYTYKEDGSAGDSGVDIFWMVVGTP